MFLRDVLQRWTPRPADTSPTDSAAAGSCRSTSLLEELAADPADFSDLARVLRLDLRTVVTTLVAEDIATPAALVAHLAARRDAETGLQRARALCAEIADRLANEDAITPAGPSSQLEVSGGGGWGRWARARGGARAHRDAAEREPRTAARQALAAP